MARERSCLKLCCQLQCMGSRFDPCYPSMRPLSDAACRQLNANLTKAGLAKRKAMCEEWSKGTTGYYAGDLSLSACAVAAGKATVRGSALAQHCRLHIVHAAPHMPPPPMPRCDVAFWSRPERWPRAATVRCEEQREQRQPL